MIGGIARSLWSGHIIQVKFHCAGVIICVTVRSTISCVNMHSILMLGGLGACRQENFENRCSEIESEGILESRYLAIQCVSKTINL